MLLNPQSLILLVTLISNIRGQSKTQDTRHLALLRSQSPCQGVNHMFLTPGVLSSGALNRGCLSRFHVDGPAHLHLQLHTVDLQTSGFQKELTAGDGGCIDFTVPQLPNTKADLTIRVSYPQWTCTWEQKLAVRISSSRIVYIQVERQRYRPGDLIKIRILCLRSDFTPRHLPIEEAWLEGPSGAWGDGIRVMQWHKVRTRLGIAQIQYKLDSQALPGKWVVRVKLADGSQGSSEFWVGDYQLPPFQLSVKHSPKVLRTSERLVWTVCVRYPWSEAVEGMLVIRLRGAGGGSGVKTAVRLRAPRPCHTHALAARRIGAHRGDVVVADFSFQEDGTGKWQNTTVISQIVDEPMSLDFITKQTAVIAPGLPYKVKIKATNWDGKPVKNEKVQVCKTPIYRLSEITNEARHFEVDTENKPEREKRHKYDDVVCSDAVTDVRGIARALFFGATADSAKFYRFDASAQNQTIHSQAHFIPVTSFSQSYAALGALAEIAKSPGSRLFIPLYVNLRSYRRPLTVHFVMITRGGNIFKWGATTQCPTNNNEFYATDRNTECPTLSPKAPIIHNANLTEDYVKELLNDQVRIMVPVKVSNQMCPYSHLVAYFMYNEEIVSASKYLEVEDCFANKADISWQSRQIPPGSTATLQISAIPLSVCGLTALDVASKWQLDPAPGIRDVLMAGLRKYMSGVSNMTGFDALGDCYASETPIQPASTMELTTTWLSESGVRVAGGGAKTSRSCDLVPPAPLVDAGEMMPRSDFSESWLWRLTGISTNGTASISSRVPDSITRFEATAFCVSKTGVAVSQPAVLQVFREFFIHADMPKKLRRGDTTIIQYRIFNYLYEPLSVQIQILSDPHLEITSPLVESACVAARASMVRRAIVRARSPGRPRITVRAHATVDGRCGNGSAVDRPSTNVTNVSDQIIMQVEIEPEGVTVRESKSSLLCAKGSVESEHSEVSWSWPTVDVVAGTESLTLWAVADVSGPLYTDSDALVVLPRGCGEQNMARLATNMLALARLDSTTPAAATAVDHIARGFSRQIQFVHPTGGFSAFGATDGIPSTWLTAFSIRYLRRAHQILNYGTPVPPAVEKSERWLLNQQMENGCFKNQGAVFHRELRGGVGEEADVSNVALTAYVVTSLVEGGVVLPAKVLKNALACLRAMPPSKTKSFNRVYSQALLTYTFIRLRKYEEEIRSTNEASLLWDGQLVGAGLQDNEELKELTDLIRMVKRSEDFVWWDTGSLSTSIEATGYAILSMSLCVTGRMTAQCGDIGRAAVRWINTHRDALGGFLSTQDTLIALEALTTWSSIQPSSSSRLNVTTLAGGHIQSVMLDPEASRVPVLMKMKENSEIKVAVHGSGCALVQATRIYNTLRPQNEVLNKMLSVQTEVRTDGPFNCDHNKTFCYCAAIVKICMMWTRQFPEMALLEVSLPGGFGADASRLYSQMETPRTLIRRIELSATDNRATFYLGSRDGSDVTTSTSGHQCLLLHAVGPRGRTKPGHVKLLDYYRPNVNDTQIFTIPEDCPSRVSHNTRNYISSENLYASARSFDDDEDFIFEEIPDDVPLEDPIYDNLRMASDNDKDNDKDKKDNIVDSEALLLSVGLSRELKNDIVISKSDIGNKNENLKNTKDSEENITNEKGENRDENQNEIPKIDTKRNIIQVPSTNKNDEIKIAYEKTDKDKINPKLENFFIIDSDKDLDVPSGIEGPVPSVVLPPPGFLPETS